MRPFLMIAVLLGSLAAAGADDSVPVATNAVTAATNAVTDVTNAVTDATNAVTDVTNAVTDATNAVTTATNAVTTATNAVTTATNAITASPAAVVPAAQTSLPGQGEVATGATNTVTTATNAVPDATNAVIACPAVAAPVAKPGHVLKVLPLFLDLKGHDAVSPSLFDRDAYQAHLRQHTNEVSAIRFDVLWKASNLKGSKLKLRAEMRGVGEHGLPRQTVLEKEVTPAFFRSWTSLKLDGDELINLGSLIAWRVTLWNGDELLGEQKSFLW